MKKSKKVTMNPTTKLEIWEDRISIWQNNKLLDIWLSKDPDRPFQLVGPRYNPVKPRTTCNYLDIFITPWPENPQNPPSI